MYIHIYIFTPFTRYTYGDFWQRNSIQLVSSQGKRVFPSNALSPRYILSSPMQYLFFLLCNNVFSIYLSIYNQVVYQRYRSLKKTTQALKQLQSLNKHLKHTPLSLFNHGAITLTISSITIYQPCELNLFYMIRRHR